MSLYEAQMVAYADLNGKPVERTPHTHPYSFDEYVIWKGEYSRSDAAVYSDRLFQWDSPKYERSYKTVFGENKRSFMNQKPKDIERFLSEYFGEPVTLTAVLRGCNYANGNPYYVFYYKDKEKKNEKSDCC